MPRRGLRAALAAVLFACSGTQTALGDEKAAVEAEALDDPAVARGAYLFSAGGCYACHTDEKGGGVPLAGGRALKTPFGIFYSPNITPDPDHGLGRWTLEDFARAMREGLSPGGDHYFPAFPYTAYTGMTDQDIADLWAYLRGQAASAMVNREHELDFPFGLRFLVGPWKWLYFEPGRFVPDPAADDRWNRGAYLARHLGHCGECHTPRNFLGATRKDAYFAGNPVGAEGDKVPNITPDAAKGIGEWSQGDIAFFLQLGMLPDGDVTGGAMEDVIRHSTSRLSDDDRAAIADYLLSVDPYPGP